MNQQMKWSQKNGNRFKCDRCKYYTHNRWNFTRHMNSVRCSVRNLLHSDTKRIVASYVNEVSATNGSDVRSAGISGDQYESGTERERSAAELGQPERGVHTAGEDDARNIAHWIITGLFWALSQTDI